MRFVIALLALFITPSAMSQETQASELQKLRCELHGWIEQTSIVRDWLNKVEQNKLVFVNQDGGVQVPPQPILWKKAAGCSNSERTNNSTEKSG
ncbi:hypothetical protein [Pseudidiomarina andamanensis]|uniref:Uncharacterized protein n=1 Tax=Pseudidiomarina andamanensis TaxID=1940690 RepID=A0AA92ETH1_9GAMM|nr:hypothetical protein [Pseudidiomarina andamanensis]MDS0219189.1 hypothetical protein [Pseudidiomarina andamanensis]QGT95930.1 hypothetical protein D3795_07060 [Pseudidiomarina andamanensis]